VALMDLTIAKVAVWGSRCQNTPKTCRFKWWLDHKASFKVDAISFRRTSSYPNYGIYEQFEDAAMR